MNWDGNGHRPDFTLTDDEVLALVRHMVLKYQPGAQLLPATSACKRLQDRAEEILNEDRAARR